MSEDSKPFSKGERKYLASFLIAGTLFVLCMGCVVVLRKVVRSAPVKEEETL